MGNRSLTRRSPNRLKTAVWDTKLFFQPMSLYKMFVDPTSIFLKCLFTRYPWAVYSSIRGVIMLKKNEGSTYRALISEIRLRYPAQGWIHFCTSSLEWPDFSHLDGSIDGLNIRRDVKYTVRKKKWNPKRILYIFRSNWSRRMKFIVNVD